MKTSCARIACCLFAFVSQIAIADDYPHAFPREGTRQLFDNERVTAWEVNWKRDVAQPIHRHRYDMAGVYLRYGPIRVTSPEGVASPQRPAFDVPRPYFQAKGITHREEMIGFPPDAPERLAIMFDLKEVQVSPDRSSMDRSPSAAGAGAQELPSAPSAGAQEGPPVAPKSGMPTAFPRAGAVQAIDNARVTEWDYTWTVGKPVPTHVHDKDSVQVFYNGGTIRTTHADGKIETRRFAFGDARFIPRGTIDAEEAIDGAPRAVTIELK